MAGYSFTELFLKLPHLFLKFNVKNNTVSSLQLSLSHSVQKYLMCTYLYTGQARATSSRNTGGLGSSILSSWGNHLQIVDKRL